MKWIKVIDKNPPKNGLYYCKVISDSGRKSKCCEIWENGEWRVGSGALMDIRVLEWLEEDVDIFDER